MIAASEEWDTVRCPRPNAPEVWAAYHAAVASGERDGRPEVGDFWVWVRETYPPRSSGAAQKQTSWVDVVARVNARIGAP